MDRRKLIQAFVFLTLLAGMLYAVRAFMRSGVRKVTYGETGKINMLMQHRIDPDVMIFGASVAMVHFNDSLIQAQTGLRTVNFGLDGTSYQQYRGLLHEFTSYTKKCRYVVFANSLFEYIPREELYEGFKFYAHLDNEYIYHSLHEIDPETMWKMRYVPFYDLVVYDERFYSLAAEGWDEVRHTLPRQSPGWFKPVHEFSFTADMQAGRVKGKRASRLVVDSSLVNDFRHDIQALNAKGIKVIVLLTPVHSSTFKKLRNIDGVRRASEKLAAGNIFMDYTRWNKCADTSLFYNYTHLNSLGADTFSADFAQRLSDINMAVDAGK